MDTSERACAEYEAFEADFKRYVEGNLRTDAETQRDRACYIEVRRDAPDVVEAKAGELWGYLRAAKHAVVYTGAGVSTSTGLPDYRGPEGVWTKVARGETYSTNDFDVRGVSPSATHMWIAEQVGKGRVKHVMSTNIDNLHVKSGLRRRIGTRAAREAAYDEGAITLSELHGNYFVVECPTCDVLSFIDTPVECSRVDPLDHTRPGDPCRACGTPRRDVVVSFHSTFEDVPSMEAEHDTAWVNTIKADLFIVFGSSLSVPTACDLVDDAAAKGARVVFVNLQKTPKDHFADLIVHAECDAVIRAMQELEDAREE